MIMAQKIWGRPKKWNLFIKNYVFICTCLNFSHLQNTLYLMQYTYWDVFPMLKNSFWTRWFWCLLVLLPFFLFHLFHVGKTFPFVDFLHPGKQRKSHSRRDQVNKDGGSRWSSSFLVKNCWTFSPVWAGALVNHPSWNGQTHSESSRKVHWSGT